MNTKHGIHKFPEAIKLLAKENPEWTIEVIELMIVKKHFNITYYNLDGIAELVIDIYLNYIKLRRQAASILNMMIEIGWSKGVDVLYGLGR